MIANAIEPGSRKSTGRPAPDGMTSTALKNTSTTTGSTIVATSVSPRRSARRSSIAVIASVAREDRRAPGSRPGLRAWPRPTSSR